MVAQNFLVKRNMWQSTLWSCLYGYRSNPNPNVCSCERLFSQLLDSPVTAVSAKSLTLWSLKVCSKTLYVAIDSVVLSLVCIL